jgi:hypothetical protein
MHLTAKHVRKGLLFLSSCLGLCLALGQCAAQPAGQPSEYEIKAAFLFNFAKFTEWPSSAFAADSSPIVIGTLGGNPFGDALERALKNKTLNNRPLVFKEFTTAEQATNCHVLFINSAEKARFPEILKTLRSSSVLTVSESDDFIAAGGMINFFPEGNKVRFQINDQAVKAGRLKLSAKLMSLASRPGG